jgi:hypothetical protein
MIMNQPSLTVGEIFSGTVAQQIVDISNVPVCTIQPMKRESTLHFGTGY